MNLVIANTNVGQDEQGRYCINDLHKAAGSEQKHQPSNFLRLENIKELVSELERSSEMRNAVNTVQGGTAQGTFVARELVYAYAMWISPKFNLQVIRAFDALVTSTPPVPSLTNEQRNAQQFISSMMERIEYRDTLNIVRELHGLPPIVPASPAIVPAESVPTQPRTHYVAIKQGVAKAKEKYTVSDLSKLSGATLQSVENALTRAGLRVRVDTNSYKITDVGKDYFAGDNRWYGSVAYALGGKFCSVEVIF